MPLDPDHRAIDVSADVAALRAHPLYETLEDADDLRRFLSAHVFCVWDFQCLLKALQRAFTCVDEVWLPTLDPEGRRLVNEIVLDEESDRLADGTHLSHYEMYRAAMRDAGADEGPIDGFTRALAGGATVDAALERPDLPPGVADFVRATMRVVGSGDAARIAGAFTYGREEAIPSMFARLVERLAERDPARWGRFRDYLVRHVQCDADEHGPKARALVARHCGADEARWRRAESAAREALAARSALWDALAQPAPAR